MRGMKTDREKAHEIVSRHGTFIGPAGSLPANVARAVAEGIALGRKEGLAVAAEAIELLRQSHAADKQRGTP
jgi:hypothetical protein